MTIDKTTKTIKASAWEAPQVQNYLDNVVPQRERKDWNVEIEEPTEDDYLAICSNVFKARMRH